MVMTSFSFSNCTLRSSTHSLRIRMTSYPCNKYEQITPSYLLSVNYQLLTSLVILLVFHFANFFKLANVLSCKQQSLAYSDMCYLLWSHVEYRIAFLLSMWMFLAFFLNFQHQANLFMNYCILTIISVNYC